MNPVPQAPEKEAASFAETAMRMGGKSEEETRRMGAVVSATDVPDEFAGQPKL